MEFIPGSIAQQAQHRDEVYERLRVEAFDDHAGALEALAMADKIAGDAELVAACDRLTNAAAQVTTFTEKRDGDRLEVSVGMGARLEGPAIVARHASAAERNRLLTTMLGIVTDPRDSEMNRASAVGALFNLSKALDHDQAEQVSSVIAPLALGHYGPSQWDHNDAHPLSRFRLSLHVPHVLWAASLAALGQLVANHSQLSTELLQHAIFNALRDGPDRIVAAALDAASRVPDVELPFYPETSIEHEDPGVRIAGLEAWAARHQTLPTGPLLEKLSSDADVNVRLQLLTMASHDGAGTELLSRFAESDPDSYVRALARHRLANPQA